MREHPLDLLPLWLLFLVLCAVTGLMMEAGYRFGRWRHVHDSDEKETPVGAIVGSILGLFAFLLAFTFGMAGSRYETRRQAVLDEANAIGTTYLRTRLLPEPQAVESESLLRRYVDARLIAVQPGRLKEGIAQSEELHGLLWAQAVKAAERDRGPITGLYIQSLNELIDLHATRVQFGLRNRIPGVIWAGLLVLAVVAMTSVGYQSGLSATRRSPAMVALLVAFVGVLYLIADLDRAQEGLLTVGQDAMLDVQRSMRSPTP